jgi:hypothetical protein
MQFRKRSVSFSQLPGGAVHLQSQLRESARSALRSEHPSFGAVYMYPPGASAHCQPLARCSSTARHHPFSVFKTQTFFTRLSAGTQPHSFPRSQCSLVDRRLDANTSARAITHRLLDHTTSADINILSFSTFSTTSQQSQHSSPSHQGLWAVCWQQSLYITNLATTVNMRFRTVHSVGLEN